jgi:predicted Abi (CAAX) family protease
VTIAALLLALPVVARSQVAIATPVPIMATTNPSQDIVGTSKPMTADSLAKVKKFAAEKKPLLMIDGKLGTVKALEALKVNQVSSAKWAVASTGDAKYYGDKAKNGVLTVITTTAKGVVKQQNGRKVLVLPNGTVLIDNGDEGGANATGTAAGTPAN